MQRSLSITDLQVGDNGKAPAGLFNLDSVVEWATRKLVAVVRAVSDRDVWASLFAATTELYHGRAFP